VFEAPIAVLAQRISVHSRLTTAEFLNTVLGSDQPEASRQSHPIFQWKPVRHL
jgi:hypothetical protein